LLVISLQRTRTPNPAQVRRRTHPRVNVGGLSTCERVGMTAGFHDFAVELRTRPKCMGGFLFQFGGEQAKDTITVLGK